jgi:hypothetical protein
MASCFLDSVAVPVPYDPYVESVRSWAEFPSIRRGYLRIGN